MRNQYYFPHETNDVPDGVSNYIDNKIYMVTENGKTFLSEESLSVITDMIDHFMFVGSGSVSLSNENGLRHEIIICMEFLGQLVQKIYSLNKFSLERDNITALGQEVENIKKNKK